MLKRATSIGRKFQNPVPTTVMASGSLLKLLPLYLTNKEERVPRRPLGPFRTDPRIYHQPPASGLRVTWMGHSILLIEIDGMRVLVDPVWDQRASPSRWFGPRRFFEAPLPLDQLPPLDAILISHDHYDHLGKATVQQLAHLEAAGNAQWVTSLGVGKSLRSFGVKPSRIAELDWTESINVPSRNAEPGLRIPTLRITALPARHFSGRSLANRFETLWSSFALSSEFTQPSELRSGQGHKVYYGADSGLWPGFAEIAEQHGPFDLTMLDTGASHELWKEIHMGPDGAVEAFQAMGAAGLLMPIHWGLFDLALHAWRQPIQRITELADKKGIRLWSPQPGLPTEVEASKELRSNWWQAGQ